MAGRFTNTNYGKTIDSLVQATKGVLNNPYYIHSNKKPTEVTYYKQNVEKTTLDEASGLNYAHLGAESPIKFNKILGFYIYGIEQMSPDMSVGDFGLEKEPVEGQALILPNTIIPTIGDMFKINYLKEDVLFRVNAINSDTLDNGSNCYQITYALYKIKLQSTIEKQVVKTYRCIVDNIGTDFKCIIEDTTIDLIEKLEGAIEQIIDAYQLFFDPKVQNFVYKYGGKYIYDPYLVEFMIRNKLMEGGREYIYLHQGCAQDKLFGYNYTRSIYYILENPEELKIRKIYYTGTAKMITDINSLFVTRGHPFFQIIYNDPDYLATQIETVPIDVIERCKNGNFYGEWESPECQIYNLMIAYFQENYEFIGGNMVELIRQLEYTDERTYYYMIPIIIFIIKRYIEHLMLKEGV